MKSNIILAAAVGLALAGCGGSNQQTQAPGVGTTTQIAIPNVAAGTNFSFDISAVSTTGPSTYPNGYMAFTDRNNKSVDVIDRVSHAVSLVNGGNVGAFAGLVPSAPGSVGGVGNGISGPDGLNVLPNGLLIAGDVGAAKVLNLSSKTTEFSIFQVGAVNSPVVTTNPFAPPATLGATTPTGMSVSYGVAGYPTSGLTTYMKTRADEGCVGPASPNGGVYYWISSPEAIPPFATIIDTGLIPTTITNAATQANAPIVLTITFTDAAGAPSAGLENCQYDATQGAWYVNNDGTTANGRGEFVKITQAAITGAAGFAVGGSSTGAINYTSLLTGGFNTSMGICDPTGLANNTDSATDIAIGCREGNAGDPLLVQIMSKSTGAILHTVTGGGGDQLVYDSRTKRYYNAASRWPASGTTSLGGAGCTAATPCAPSLNIIDAVGYTVVERLPAGNNSHSVAVDPVTGLVYMPFSSATVPPGCGTCTANGFVNGGVLVIQP